MHFGNESFLITYNHKLQTFTYPEKFCINNTDKRPLYRILLEEGIMTSEDAAFFKEQLTEVAEADEQEIYFDEFLLDFNKNKSEWFRVGFIGVVPKETVHIVITNIDDEKNYRVKLSRQAKRDELTGLLNMKGFVDAVMVQKTMGSEESAVLYIDVVRFKVINELFGIEEGNKLLCYIAGILREKMGRETPIARLNADRFVMYIKLPDNLEMLMDDISNKISEYEVDFEVTCNIGVYVTGHEAVSVSGMIDRANLALSAIKGSYSVKYNYYKDELRNELISEQEITGIMGNALNEKQFILHYQPKYDHSTGTLLSAEALVRWKHPVVGLISPGVFIPIFEKNGFITKLDYYVFEQVCLFLKKCMGKNLPLIPISVNFSRHDIFQPNFVECLEKIRSKYDIPVNLLHVEITESAVVGNSKRANEIVKHLHDFGYIVEMDDFGSGYSSLNVLKEIDFDVVKLDMMFMSNELGNNRGGTIVSSIVRMAKWLKIPVIAEGVETVTQADFLKSVGCNYIQGYLYSKPLPEDEYIEKLSGNTICEMVPQLRLNERLNACDFWDPNSQETLIFSNYVGAAAIFTYDKGNLEILRVNQKYLKELSMNLSEKELIEKDPWIYFDESNRRLYENMLDRAILSGEEEESETWRTISSDCCGVEKFCIRSSVMVIGKSGDCYLLHAMVRNITSEKLRYNEMVTSEKRFMAAAEQLNVYYWEYTIATKEMRPCFRCMRDLGFPAVLRNYPDSAIEMGVFPEEVADMYRDWHVQLANGVEKLEAVMPLTVGKIPFIVRYTNEFDENGRPVKAYGSATLVV